MCFAPRRVSPFSPARAYGMTEFECGACPECMQKRASTWVLRCVAEAKTRKELHQGVCMVTLTYDNFVRDENGHLIFDRRTNSYLELPPDRSLKCSKRDVQLFMKRLRKKFGDGIKYMATAEHGSRTHRAHYHIILFGVSFPDLVPYKRSKRGNQIFTSRILTRLWSKGICTVDSSNVSASIARYVTKYSLKQVGDFDTFSLFSHGVGSEWLWQHFNGRPYVIEGRQYSIPRFIWNRYIWEQYPEAHDVMSYRYIAKDDPRYARNQNYLENFRDIRDQDPLYRSYISQIKYNHDVRELTRPDVFTRVRLLDEKKFALYKRRFQVVYGEWKEVVACHHPSCRDFIPFVEPNRFLNPVRTKIKERKPLELRKIDWGHLTTFSCHNTSNDTIPLHFQKKRKKLWTFRQGIQLNLLTNPDLYVKI